MYKHPILQKLLEQIGDLPFSRPVTGYLIDAYRINLKGESMRKRVKKLTTPGASD